MRAATFSFVSNPMKLSACLEDETVRCIVETPRGSHAKFKYDPEAKLFTLVKSLVAGLTYPYDWGFVPSTLAPDGDALDVMVLHDVATFPGMMLCCRLVGVLELYDIEDGEKMRNPRLFAVPVGSHREQEIADVADLPKRLRKELVTFFAATSALQKKEIEVIDWAGPKRARALLDEAMAAYKEKEKEKEKE